MNNHMVELRNLENGYVGYFPNNNYAAYFLKKFEPSVAGSTIYKKLIEGGGIYKGKWHMRYVSLQNLEIKNNFQGAINQNENRI